MRFQWGMRRTGWWLLATTWQVLTLDLACLLTGHLSVKDTGPQGLRQKCRRCLRVGKPWAVILATTARPVPLAPDAHLIQNAAFPIDIRAAIQEAERADAAQRAVPSNVGNVDMFLVHRQLHRCGWPEE